MKGAAMADFWCIFGSLCAAIGVIVVLSLRCDGERRSSGWLFAGRDELGSDTASLTLILEMLAVSISQGASIPHALISVGNIVGAVLGRGMAAVGESLHRGSGWHEAWACAMTACDSSAGCGGQSCMAQNDEASYSEEESAMEALLMIRSALETSWNHGTSPVLRLRTTIEQLDKRSRATIERNAAALSVKLLMPMGLCFLPAFVCIGVIPAIASFMG